MIEVDRSFIIKVAVCTLAFVIIAVVCAMLFGLFDPRVDNKDIFETIKPAFLTIVGCLVGLVSGFYAGKK